MSSDNEKGSHMVHHLIDQNGDLVFYKLECIRSSLPIKTYLLRLESHRAVLTSLISHCRSRSSSRKRKRKRKWECKEEMEDKKEEGEGEEQMVMNEEEGH
jgi:hypothetical protein